MLRRWVLTSLRACLVLVGPARGYEPHGFDAEAWMSLPRLQEGPKGEHLVVTLGTCLYDVDTRTGKASVLPHADGRLRAGAKYHHPAVTFSPDDTYLTYLRSWRSHTSLVVRDLQYGR